MPDLPLKGAIQEPQDMQQQSFAPAVQSQYPAELGTNPMLRQDYDLNQQSQQYLKRSMQLNNQQAAGRQMMNDTLNFMYANAPSKDQFQQDFSAARAAHENYVKVLQKTGQIAAQPHAGQKAAIAISALLGGPLGAIAAYQGSGLAKSHAELQQAVKDLQNAKLLDTDSEVTKKRDWDLYNDLISATAKVHSTTNEAINSGAHVAAEGAAIGSHLVGLAEAPGNIAHVKQQTLTSESQQKLNDYYRTHGGPETKLQGEKLHNEYETQAIEHLKHENAQGPEAKLSPVQNLHIKQLDEDLRASHSKLQRLQTTYDKFNQALAVAAQSPEDLDLQKKAVGFKTQLPTLLQQIHDEEHNIATTKALQDKIVTPFHGQRTVLHKPPEPNADEAESSMKLPTEPEKAKPNKVSLKAKYHAIFMDKTDKYSQEEKDKAHEEYLFLAGK